MELKHVNVEYGRCHLIGGKCYRIVGFFKKLRVLSTVGVFIRRDLIIATSYKLQFVFQLFQVFFGIVGIHFIGKMVATAAPSPLLEVYGANYFSFAIVGLAVNSYMKAGMITVTNDLRQSMNQGIFEAMCATPIAYWSLMLHSTIWPFIFETARVTFYFVCGYAFFGLRLPHANWPVGFMVLLLSVLIFFMLGIISCSFLVLVKRGDPVNWFFSSISGILAGTMFPISVFPKWLRISALCLPLTHSLEAMRMCLLKGCSLFEIRGSVYVLVGYAMTLVPLTFMFNRICMNRARKQGSFGAF